jgi:hypothetical protein
MIFFRKYLKKIKNKENRPNFRKIIVTEHHSTNNTTK